MVSDYTPTVREFSTTEDVSHACGWAGEGIDFKAVEEQQRANFDRWLNDQQPVHLYKEHETSLCGVRRVTPYATREQADERGICLACVVAARTPYSLEWLQSIAKEATDDETD